MKNNEILGLKAQSTKTQEEENLFLMGTSGLFVCISHVQ